MSIHRPIALAEHPALLPQAAAAGLAALYPRDSGLLPHGLAGHPLLSLEALATATERMAPGSVERRRAANRNGAGFPHAERDESIAETVRHISTSGCWVMLSGAEQLPDYAALMTQLVEQLTPVISPATGALLRPKLYVFISAPGALTPFHMDAEYNLLFQIAGTKRFAVYPAQGPWLSDEAHERYHESGDNVLAWDAAFADGGTVYPLAPGDTLYVPYKCPHWVEAGGEPSISLSLTWCSAESFEQEAAWRFNAWLRRRGLKPRPPAQPAARAFAWRAIDRMGLGTR